jgi:demethoxyubiquinone hydroxylase (CLK1/Coq7/Cat5 family)
MNYLSVSKYLKAVIRFEKSGTVCANYVYKSGGGGIKNVKYVCHSHT